jgi:acetoin utilization protein AcuB
VNVSDIMTAKPTTVRLKCSLREALETMERLGCHHLPIMSEDDHLIGIVSDRDCRTALNSPHTLRDRWQDEELADKLPVRAIMTPAPIVIPPDARAEDAARSMLKNQISCLPVMREETLVGIVTRSDILSAFIQQAERLRHLPVDPIS